jgi:hypothetical protein
MKKTITLALLASELALLPSQIAHAQGTFYVSTLGLPSTGSASVGNDSWLATDFETGTNAGGYLLNSVQLALANASGNPSGFAVMIYNQDPHIVVGAAPGTSIGSLNGSLDPVSSGIYSYSPASTLILSPSTTYFIVLSSGTATADGAYEWSVTSTRAPSLAGGWNGDHYLLSASDGLRWGPGPSSSYAQFAVSATAIPEPAAVGLLGLGGCFLFWRRRSACPG